MTQSDRRLLSLVFLSVGVLVNFGNLSSIALGCVLVSLGLCIHSFSPAPLGPRLPRFAAIALVLGLGAATVLYNNKLPHGIFAATFALLAVAIVIHSLVRATAVRLVAFGLAASSVAIGIAANITWGFANIDVFQFQQDASQALLHGQNPYSPIVASPEIVAPGVPAWLHLHLPYGPTLPVLEAPFRLLGDIRVLHILAALVISGAVLVLARRAGTLDRSACVVMAFPLTAGMILFSWVDVITMAGLAVWLVSFRTHPRIATFALVLALAAKPTTLIALVPIFFWSIRARRQVIIAAAIAALFVLPFAIITGLSQFYYNVIGVQLAVLPRLELAHRQLVPQRVQPADPPLRGVGADHRHGDGGGPAPPPQQLRRAARRGRPSSPPSPSSSPSGRTSTTTTSRRCCSCWRSPATSLPSTFQR